ncbi:hypothetical protein Back11_05280 [Paenibacillus baekrokdamisoli]|uniref:Uncharacterized protein n=1 Tax=Paenibacillus baekrokdamisoli TaxID=1712516 RepID=A0A3G9J3A0_9BACL|nr:hypothetical protein [Paenibacillus baekrokdamisoli]MBB3067630.1 transcriptional regulator GlxA family with amidase domain [Paenibacillus baekrokdamisoli]BBH19183.1 hypothetical protein Back11_05280 [Paenibacillus baekrokdamisoli]
MITAGGVSAALDLGLYVVELFSDAETVEQIQQAMDYPYYNSNLLNHSNNPSKIE